MSYGLVDDPQAVVEKLHAALRGSLCHYVIKVGQDLKMPRAELRRLEDQGLPMTFLSRLIRTPTREWSRHFGCDAVVNDEGMIEEHRFPTMSGAGHQTSSNSETYLAKGKDSRTMRSALRSWRYRDSSPTMPLGCEDDRRYAIDGMNFERVPVRHDPSEKSPAIAALPLFPVRFYSGTTVRLYRLQCVAARYLRYWPIWEGWWHWMQSLSLGFKKPLHNRKQGRGE